MPWKRDPHGLETGESVSVIECEKENEMDMDMDLGMEIEVDNSEKDFVPLKKHKANEKEPDIIIINQEGKEPCSSTSLLMKKKDSDAEITLDGCVSSKKRKGKPNESEDVVNPKRNEPASSACTLPIFAGIVQAPNQPAQTRSIQQRTSARQAEKRLKKVSKKGSDSESDDYVRPHPARRPAAPQISGARQPTQPKPVNDARQISEIF